MATRYVYDEAEGRVKAIDDGRQDVATDTPIAHDEGWDRFRRDFGSALAKTSKTGAFIGALMNIGRTKAEVENEKRYLERQRIAENLDGETNAIKVRDANIGNVVKVIGANKDAFGFERLKKQAKLYDAELERQEYDEYVKMRNAMSPEEADAMFFDRFGKKPPQISPALIPKPAATAAPVQRYPTARLVRPDTVYGLNTQNLPSETQDIVNSNIESINRQLDTAPVEQNNPEELGTIKSYSDIATADEIRKRKAIAEALASVKMTPGEALQDKIQAYEELKARGVAPEILDKAFPGVARSRGTSSSRKAGIEDFVAALPNISDDQKKELAATLTEKHRTNSASDMMEAAVMLAAMNGQQTPKIQKNPNSLNGGQKQFALPPREVALRQLLGKIEKWKTASDGQLKINAAMERFNTLYPQE
jgi:hypothetical protein